MQLTNSWKVTAIVGLVALAVGYGSALLTQPEKVVTKTQEVIKTVTVEHTNQTTTKTVIKKPDGTTITQEKTEDTHDLKTSENQRISIDKQVSNSKPDWMVSATAGFGYDRSLDPVYGVSVQRRILGNIYMGAYGMTNKNVGLSVGLQF